MNENFGRLMERLWQRMLELFGRQWESSYGHVDGDAFATWRDSLAGLTAKQIKTGLDAVIAKGNEFPPNLIKFLRLCTTVPPIYYRPIDIAALPAPKVCKRPNVVAAKDKHFKAMKELLGKQE